MKYTDTGFRGVEGTERPDYFPRVMLIADKDLNPVMLALPFDEKGFVTLSYELLSNIVDGLGGVIANEDLDFFDIRGEPLRIWEEMVND